MKRKGTLAPWLVLGVCIAVEPGAARAGDECEKPAAAGRARTEAIRGAAERGLQVVQTAARNYPQHRECFSCHHQTLPMHAMAAAKAASLEIDEDLFRSQYEFTRSSFAERAEQLRKGQGIGGRAMTVAYGLWTFEIAGNTFDKPEDAEDQPGGLTDAMVAYLLQNQVEDGRWSPPSNRPPLEESDLMCTVLAAWGIEWADAAEHKEAADASVARAKAWMAAAPLASTEDHAARLWGVYLFDEEDDAVAAARRRLLDLQQEDGSWAQVPGMAGDAYSTGQALALLHGSGLPAGDPAFQKGIDFLLSTQQEDGSWFVQTRSKPVQVFFDNGDPHGKSQFISIAASSWAVTALAAGLLAEE